MIRHLLTRFRPKPPRYGTVLINPYTVLMVSADEVPPRVIETLRQLSAQVRHYQDRMVAFHRANRPRYGRLQQVMANWDIDADQLTVLVMGDRSFTWTGTPAAFLAGGMDTPPPAERHLELVVDA